jgi:HEAT repeat protein
MLDIGRTKGEHSQFVALRAAGYLYGKEALPLLTTVLARPEYSTRFEAVYALGNTRCRDAVSLLIPMLIDPIRTFAARPETLWLP